jgi:hypothetical protein
VHTLGRAESACGLLVRAPRANRCRRGVPFRPVDSFGLRGGGMISKVDLAAVSLVLLVACSGTERMHVLAGDSVHHTRPGQNRRDLTMASGAVMVPEPPAPLEMARVDSTDGRKHRSHRVRNIRPASAASLVAQVVPAPSPAPMHVQLLDFKAAPASEGRTGAVPLEPGQTVRSIPASTGDSGPAPDPSFEGSRERPPRQLVGGVHGGGTCRGRRHNRG